MTDTSKDGVSYLYIKTDSFKTTLMSVGFYLPLDKGAAANSLALSLMRSGTKELPDTELFNRRLASLYGASVSSDTSKAGDTAVYRLGITVIDGRYSFDGENIPEKAGNLLIDMIFSRFSCKSKYPADAVRREKRLLAESIAAEQNDKRIFARKRCEQIMCGNEAYGLSPDGTESEVKALTSDDASAALDRLIKEARIAVIVIGNEEPAGFKEKFFALAESAGRNYRRLADDVLLDAGNLKRVAEKLPVKQGKLVIGLRRNCGGNDIETASAWVMADVFGGGPYSKLFCNVREKMSLCYYCSARSVRKKGLIFVESGVEEQNIEKAEAAILAELDKMKNGDFTEKELGSSKLALCDALHSVEADQPALAGWYTARAFCDSAVSPSEAAEAVGKVTAGDVKKAAADFSADTVYVLRPEDNKENKNEL